MEARAGGLDPGTRRYTATSNERCRAAAADLLSDDVRNVTGATLYVASGYHAMGM